jgi:hypothetical protein
MVCRSTSRAAGSEELQASNERDCLSAGWTKRFVLWLVIRASSVNLLEQGIFQMQKKKSVKKNSVDNSTQPGVKGLSVLARNFSHRAAHFGQIW